MDNAIADIQEAIRIKPDFASQVVQYLVYAFLQRAKSCCDKHDWDRAIADLNEAQWLNSLYPASNALPAFGRSDSEARRPDTDVPKVTAPSSDYHYTGDAFLAEAQKPNEWAAPSDRSTIAPFEIIPPAGWDPNHGLSPQGIPAAAELPAGRSAANDRHKSLRTRCSHSPQGDGPESLWRDCRPTDRRLSWPHARIRREKRTWQGHRRFVRSAALDPQRYDVMIDRGIMFRKKGDYDKAIADFSAAIRARVFPLRGIFEPRNRILSRRATRMRPSPISPRPSV